MLMLLLKMVTLFLICHLHSKLFPVGWWHKLDQIFVILLQCMALNESGHWKNCLLRKTFGFTPLIMTKVLWMALFSWVPIFIDWAKITHFWGSNFLVKAFFFIIHKKIALFVGTRFHGSDPPQKTTKIDTPRKLSHPQYYACVKSDTTSTAINAHHYCERKWPVNVWVNARLAVHRVQYLINSNYYKLKDCLSEIRRKGCKSFNQQTNYPTTLGR